MTTTTMPLQDHVGLRAPLLFAARHPARLRPVVFARRRRAWDGVLFPAAGHRQPDRARRPRGRLRAGRAAVRRRDATSSRARPPPATTRWPRPAATWRAAIRTLRKRIAELTLARRRTRRHRAARRCPPNWSPNPAAAWIRTCRRVPRRCRSRASPGRAASTIAHRRTRCWPRHVEAPQFGVLGQPRVNVLATRTWRWTRWRADPGPRPHRLHAWTATAAPRPMPCSANCSGEGGGRLTVFLGAAPGVGKTYAMLSRARELRQQGVDVVVGLVETHGRAETAGAARRPRGAAAQRACRRTTRPARWRNSISTPCSRASRRWRWWTNWRIATRRAAATSAAGRMWSSCWTPASTSTPRSTSSTWKASTTWSTGSPACASARPCRISSSTALRDIVLIDLPPRELIERLQQGKVYMPDQAAQALQSFFSPSNLTALRELAMQTGRRSRRQPTCARRRPRVACPVPMRRRVLVAIDGRGTVRIPGARGAARWPNGAMRRGRVVSVHIRRRRPRRRRATRARPAPSRWRAGSAAKPNCCTAPRSSTR